MIRRLDQRKVPIEPGEPRERFRPVVFVTLLEHEVYAAFWDLLRLDGWGGADVPYESRCAWLDENEIPRRDRRVFHRLFRCLLDEYMRSRKPVESG